MIIRLFFPCLQGPQSVFWVMISKVGTRILYGPKIRMVTHLIQEPTTPETILDHTNFYLNLNTFCRYFDNFNSHKIQFYHMIVSHKVIFKRAIYYILQFISGKNNKYNFSQHENSMLNTQNKTQQNRVLKDIIINQVILPTQ